MRVTDWPATPRGVRVTKTRSRECGRLPMSVDWSSSGRLLSQWSNSTAETGLDRK